MKSKRNIRIKVNWEYIILLINNRLGPKWIMIIKWQAIDQKAVTLL